MKRVRGDDAERLALIGSLHEMLSCAVAAGHVEAAATAAQALVTTAVAQRDALLVRVAGAKSPPNNPPARRGVPPTGETAPSGAPGGSEEKTPPPSPYERLSRRFLEEQRRNWPRLVREVSSAKVRAGAEAVRLAVERDGYPLREVAEASRWAAEHREFWSRNLLSLSSLRNVCRNGETKLVNIMARMDEERERAQKRNDSPALRPALPRDVVEAVAEVLGGPHSGSAMDGPEHKAALEIGDLVRAAWEAAPEDEPLPGPPWVRRGLRGAYNTPAALARGWAEWVRRRAVWVLRDGPPSWRYLRATWDRTWGGFAEETERAGVRAI